MNDQPEPIPWDFLSIIECWNLYGLPLLLVLAVTIVVARRNRLIATDADAIAKQSARRLGLIHYLLALGFLLVLAQELFSINDVRTYLSVASIFALIFQFYIPAIAITANALVGFGLRRLSRVARNLAILWNLLCSALAILSIWLVYPRAYFDPARWPDLVVAKLLSVILLVILLLPRMKLAFAPGPTTNPERPDTALSVSSQSITTIDRAISLITILLLLIVASTVIVDISDWIVRVAFPSDLDVAPVNPS
jgi:hypothetical protein